MWLHRHRSALDLVVRGSSFAMATICPNVERSRPCRGSGQRCWANAQRGSQPSLIHYLMACITAWERWARSLDGSERNPTATSTR
jgi:hypothetical protein